ncbi:pyruvate formate lyase-activating protein [Ruminococcaceae bacterium OttesenSCG-928-A16]|nr:pyruvate formate lyase-activating protein [Ruminococcaceae bacterium OttesenSCG-928-A16]
MTPQEREQLRSITGTIHATETFGTVDGPGIRFVLFLQGCPLRCLYCHNPDATTGKGGQIWTAGQAVDEIMRYRQFIKNGGVTFSGGEPLMQPKFVEATARLLREEGIHTAIDTAGCQDPDDVAPALDAADLILLDIKAFSPQIAERLTGQTNELAIATLDYCEEVKKPVWVRHVLLEGYTLDEKELDGLAEFLTQFSCVERVELLPFHKLGEPKWDEMARTYELKDVPATTREQTEWAKGFFTRRGLKVQ